MQFGKFLRCMMTPKNVMPKVCTTLAVSLGEIVLQIPDRNTEKPEK